VAGELREAGPLSDSEPSGGQPGEEDGASETAEDSDEERPGPAAEASGDSEGQRRRRRRGRRGGRRNRERREGDRPPYGEQPPYATDAPEPTSLWEPPAKPEASWGTDRSDEPMGGPIAEAPAAGPSGEGEAAGPLELAALPMTDAPAAPAWVSAPEPSYDVSSVAVETTVAVLEPGAVEAPPEPEPEVPAGPPRRGWWQRKVS
jgi:ribonuclease E